MRARELNGTLRPAMLRLLALLALLSAVLSCGGDTPTESSAFSGTFDLVTVDSAMLPRLETITLSLDTLYITGGEIRALSRGRLSLVQRVRWHRRVGGPLSEQPDTVITSYRLSGTQLLIDYTNSVPHGPYKYTATFDGTAIVVQSGVRIIQAGSPRREHRYQRR